MRIRIIEVEGTPEELAELPEVQAAFAPTAGASPAATKLSAAVPADGGESAAHASDQADLAMVLPKQIRDFVRSRAGSRARTEVVQRFVAEVLGWGTTEAEPGTSTATDDGLNNYLRLYNKGPRYFGAFCYVTPGSAKVTFRLPASAAKGYQHAAKRGKAGYEIVVYLTSEAAFDEAVELAKLAYDGVVA